VCKEPERNIDPKSNLYQRNFQSQWSTGSPCHGKVHPKIRGGPEKEVRVAVLVSGLKFEKLLGVPTVQRGTGKLVAELTANILLDWHLTEESTAMYFDTTVANSLLVV